MAAGRANARLLMLRYVKKEPMESDCKELQAAIETATESAVSELFSSTNQGKSLF
jgi:hypothetical protein